MLIRVRCLIWIMPIVNIISAITILLLYYYVIVIMMITITMMIMIILFLGPSSFQVVQEAVERDPYQIPMQFEPLGAPFFARL